MFRLSQYMHQLLHPTPPRRRRGSVKPVVIWNLTRRCNLRCRHCYTVSADVEFPGELTSDQAMGVLDDLGGFGIPALILSGGEPLARRDFFELAERARGLVRYLALSTNGTAIVGETADRVAAIGFDYVGISLDGIGATNDWFRGQNGAFDMALAGARACKARGIKVGLRFTLTRDNADQLPDLLALADDEGIDKFYLSHLVYAGRGDKHRGEDAEWSHSRQAMDFLIERGWDAVQAGRPLEIVTGNNDADAVYMLRWAERNFTPDQGPPPARASRGLGRQFLGRRGRQYRPAGQGAPGYILVRLHGRFRQGPPVHRTLDRRRPDAGAAPPQAAAAEGPVRCLCLSGGLRRQHAHPRAAIDRRSMGRGPGLLPDRYRDRRRDRRTPDHHPLPRQEP